MTTMLKTTVINLSNIEFTNDDVVLYMLGDAPKQEQEEQVSILTQSVEVDGVYLH
jgi:hypothetical protein